jgi:hypothetical protein
MDCAVEKDLELLSVIFAQIKQRMVWKLTESCPTSQAMC